MKSEKILEVVKGNQKAIYSKLPNGQFMKIWFKKGNNNVFFPIGYSIVDNREMEEANSTVEREKRLF